MTVVVKVGGARAVDPAGTLADIAATEEDVLLVHGGSTAVDEALERMGIEPEYVETPDGVVGRFTDAETMEVFTMVMAGTLNTELVAGLREQGADALGLSGVDGGLLTGPRKSAVRVVEDGKRKIRRGDHSGRVDRVNDELLAGLLADGYTPVTGPPMLADDGTPVNADADRVAAAVAAALDATLVVLTDVEGIYADPDDPGTRFDAVETPADLAAVREAAEGFMTKKVMAAVEALEGGAAGVVVADANAERPVSGALAGAGTRFAPGAIASNDENGADDGDADDADDGANDDRDGDATDANADRDANESRDGDATDDGDATHQETVDADQ